MTDIESRAQRQVDLARRVAAEVVGSAFLLAMKCWTCWWAFLRDLAEEGYASAEGYW